MEAYSGKQFVGIDLHRRRSVIVRTTEGGEVLETVRIVNDVERLASVMARAGECPEVVLEATYGWYWARCVAGCRLLLQRRKRRPCRTRPPIRTSLTRRSAAPDWAIRSRHYLRHVGPASLCTKYGHDGVRFGSVQESLYVTKASNSRDLTWSGACSKSTTSLPEASEESGSSHHSRLLSTLPVLTDAGCRTRCLER
jgi:hypothetical protein